MNYILSSPITFNFFLDVRIALHSFMPSRCILKMAKMYFLCLFLFSVAVATATEYTESEVTPVWVKSMLFQQSIWKRSRRLWSREKTWQRGVVKSNIGGHQSDVDWIHREGKRKAVKKLQNVLLKNAAEFVFQWQNTGLSRTKDGSLDFPMFEVWLNGGWVNSNSY